jgi:Oxidoreductase family, NAD-binding Rossmann fold
MAGPVTLAVLGAGARGSTYAGFAAQHGDRARVVALAEPRAERREALADELEVPAAVRFADWRELAGRPRLADAVIVATHRAARIAGKPPDGIRGRALPPDRRPGPRRPVNPPGQSAARLAEYPVSEYD